MRKGGLWLALVLVALLGVMAADGLLEQPPPLRTHSSPGQFDAARAKARLAFILGDQRPHPADSVADDEVRSRLLTSLHRIGLTTMVRDQFACNELYKQRGVSCARVRNVIARLGPATGRALLLNAHYDSVPVGPGASDDGAGVATLLEVGSILSKEALKRPVILLFNEGEELGLVGARAFLADPLSRNVDSLVNLEARGVRGPVNMFETSRPNAAAVELFAAAAKNPVANSLSTDVYRLLPNYTDVNSLSERNWLTLNLAPIGNETRYHSAGDNLAALDPAMLQHMGDQTLELARQLAWRTPASENSNRIFMDLAGRALVSLPLAAGALLLIILLVIFLVLSVRTQSLASGAGTLIAAMTGSSILTLIMLALIGLIRGGTFWRAYPILSHQAAYASAVLCGTALIATLARGLSRQQLRTAYWLVFLAFGGFIALAAPGGIIMVIFPPLAAALGLLLGRWWKPAQAIGSAIAILLLFMTWGAILGLLGELLDNGPMWVFAPLGSILILPVLIEAKPLIVRAGTGSAMAVCGALAILGWTAVAAAPAYSEDRQQRLVIQQISDVSNGKSWWSVLNDGAPVPANFPGTWTWSTLPLGSQPRWIAPAAQPAGTSAPEVQLIGQIVSGDERVVDLRLIANGNQRIELVAPDDSKIRAAGAADFIRPIDQTEPGKFSISCSGRSCDGALIRLRIGKPRPIEFMIVGSRAELPPGGAPYIAARPKFARPQYRPDESLALVEHRL